MNVTTIQQKRQAGISTILNPKWQSNHKPPMNVKTTQWKRQRGISTILLQWQSDNLPAVNGRAIQWKRQAEISIILSSTMTIRPLTDYEYMRQGSTLFWIPQQQSSHLPPINVKGKDQHHSKFTNNNQTTSLLWMWVTQWKRQGLASFWMPQAIRLLTSYEY